MFNYDDQLGALDLSDYCKAVVIDSEAPVGFADSGVFIPGRPGVLLDREADRGPLVLPIRMVIRDTDEDGDITHEDGREGHYEENLSAIKAEFGKGVVTYKRTFPHKGTLRAVGHLVDSGPGSDRNVYGFSFLVESGSWQSDTESSNSGAPATGVTTSGDTVIHDPRVSLASSGTRTIVANGITYSIVAASGPTYPVVIDVGAGTATANGGADALGAITFSHEHWFRLQPNHTHVVTGGSATWYWRNRWG